MKTSTTQTVPQDSLRLCLACQEVKPIDEFHKDSKGRAGFRVRCKACVQAAIRQYRKLNPERARIISRRARDKVRDQWASQRRHYIETHPNEVRASRQRYYLYGRNLIKDKARQQLRDAIRAGTVTREPCEKCGGTPSQAHHHDYSKPFEVTWLCRPCHHAHHATERGLSRDLSTAPLVSAATGGAR